VRQRRVHEVFRKLDRVLHLARPDLSPGCY
jgi:hypothetical protein